MEEAMILRTIWRRSFPSPMGKHGAPMLNTLSPSLRMLPCISQEMELTSLQIPLTALSITWQDVMSFMRSLLEFRAPPAEKAAGKPPTHAPIQLRVSGRFPHQSGPFILGRRTHRMCSLSRRVQGEHG